MNSWCKCNMAGRWAAKTPTDHSHIAALCLHPAYPVVLDADKEQCLKQAAKEVIKESKHYCGASVATPAKAKSSFQITSVTVGSSRLSNDGGEDSADDLDESHTDDNSRVTDNETPSFSEDTMSKEDAFYGAVAGQAPTTAPVIPTSAEYGLAIVPEEAKEIASAERDSSLDVTVVQRPEDVPRSDSTRSCTVDMSPDKISQPPVSTPTRPVRHERFKVVKIESEEPFRRGRWTCMDYFDHSVHMPVTSPFPSCCPWASPRPSVATVAQPLPASSKTTTAAQQRGQMQPTASRSQFGNQNAQRPRQPQQQTSQYQAPATAAKQPLTNTFATKSAFTKVPLTTAYQQQTYAQQPQQAQFSSQQAAPQQQTYISSQVSAQYQNVQPQYVQAPHKVPTNLPGVPLYNRQVQTPAQGSPVSAPLGYAQVSTSQTYTGQTSTQYQPSASTQAYSTSTPQPAQAQAHYVSATPRVTAVPIPSPAPYLAQTSASTGQPQSQQPTYAGATSTSVTQTSTGQSVVQPSVSQQTIASATSQSATSVNQTTTGSVTSVQGQQVSGATSRTTPSTSTVNTTEHGPSRFIATVSPTYPDGKAIPPSTTASVATSITSVNTAHTAIITTDEDSTSTANTVAIDNKIEQAMDLVKSHLMFAVREEVEVLKEKIAELMDRINQLEYENGLLKTHATPETLAQVSALQAVMSGTTPMQHRPIAQTGGGGSQQ